MKFLDFFNLRGCSTGCSRSFIIEEGQVSAERRAELMGWRDVIARLVEELHINGTSTYTFEIYGQELDINTLKSSRPKPLPVSSNGESKGSVPLRIKIKFQS